MSFCEVKLNEESDLVTVRGICGGKEGLGNVYTKLKQSGFEPWTVCRCEMFRRNADLTFLIPTGRLCELLDVIKEIKKTTPHLTTLIRTGVVKIDLSCNDSMDFLNVLLSKEEFPKPEFLCASQGKIELVFESYEVPVAISIITEIK